MTSASVSEVNDGAVGDELLLELHVVLDDPVDDDVDAVVGVEVRVGVGLGDAAVGRPARVADAGGRRARRRARPTPPSPARRALDRAAERVEVADRADGVEAPSPRIEMPAES